MATQLNQFDSVEDASSLGSDGSRLLIDRARNGCNDALTELVRSMRGYLLLIANQELNTQLKAKVGASDVVQSVLLRAEQKLPEFRGNSKQTLLGWLRKMLLNEIIAVHRKYAVSEKRNVGREVGLPDERRQGQPLYDPGHSPQSNAVMNEDAWRLRNAVERLPADYRTVIVLRNWDQLSFHEIGDHMNRSVEAAKKLWQRAIRQLEKELKDE